MEYEFSHPCLYEAILIIFRCRIRRGRICRRLIRNGFYRRQNSVLSNTYDSRAQDSHYDVVKPLKVSQ